MTTSILVVDDEPAVLLTYTMILRQHGYDVFGVATARQAKQVLQERGFDLLICDLALESSQSGFDVLRAARERYPSLPALLLTGYATSEIAEEAKRQHVSLLFKPIEVETLLRSIADHVGRPRRRAGGE
ncbi:MAG: response regulator [Terriglobales bacterium]